MAISDFDKTKYLSVTSATGSPTVSFVQPVQVTSGDETTTGTGDIVLDWTNITSTSDIAVYDENDNLLDYYLETFDTSSSTAVIWVYRDWVRDGSTQAQIAYGSGASDQSVSADKVFDKESTLDEGYLFNESSGDLLDITSENNNGTVYGATRDASGQMGKAYSFDGTDDYVALPNSVGNYTDTFTITTWFKTSDTENNVRVAVTRRVSGGTTQYDISTLSWADTLNINDGNNCYGSIVVDDGVWHYGVFVINGSSSKLYVDGSQDSLSSQPSISGDAADANIAAWSDGTYGHSNALISNIRVYNNVLSSDIVTAKYDATKDSPTFFSQSLESGGGDTSSSLLLSYNF